MKTKCKACKGTGWDNRSACMNCNGSGLKLKKEIPDPTTQLKADKAELLEALEIILKENMSWYDLHTGVKSLIQKHK